MFMASLLLTISSSFQLNACILFLLYSGSWPIITAPKKKKKKREGKNIEREGDLWVDSESIIPAGSQSPETHKLRFRGKRCRSLWRRRNPWSGTILPWVWGSSFPNFCAAIPWRTSSNTKNHALPLRLCVILGECSSTSIPNPMKPLLSTLTRFFLSPFILLLLLLLHMIVCFWSSC